MLRQGSVRLGTAGISLAIAVSLTLLATSSMVRGATGSINPNNLEIDVGAGGANLYLNDLTTANLVDWVADSLPNTDTPSLENSVATGILPGVTGRVGGTGHWNGVRIVDGVANKDQDIFLTGGKENDTSTWNVGPGSVGSSKYDITQAYLANNQDHLYFGMERRGNNGTTAFDFEFNQKPPLDGSYVPDRTIGDVLFTFEMNGSGNSGSAVGFYFVWNGSAYVASTLPAGALVSSINNVPVDAAPWGRVDSKGNWAATDLERFEFAEASALLSAAFPDFDACGNTAYVQVRTRSSATATSDLKDTTRYFVFQFGGPAAVVGELVPNCLGQFTYDGSGSTDANGGNNLTYEWRFEAPQGVTLSGTGITQNLDGSYKSTSVSGTVNVDFGTTTGKAVINAILTVVEGAACSSEAPEPGTVEVYPVLVAAIDEKTADGANLSVELKGSAATATSLQWQKKVGGSWVNITGATTGTLVYSSFETDATASSITFPIEFGGTDVGFAGKLWSVEIRLHAERLVDGLLCEDDSDPIVIRKVTAVDP